MKIKGLYQKGRVWYWQPPMKKGHRPPAVSLGTTDRSEALRRYEYLSRQDTAARKTGRILIEASRYVLEKSARGRHTPKTAANTLHILGQLARWQCPGEHGRMVADLTPDMLQRYASDLGTHLSPTSIRSKFGSIRGFCSWLVAQGFLEKNPCLGLELPRLVATRRDRYCSREERDLLLSRCDRDDLALVLHLGFLAGLRAGEIIAARRDWVDVPAGVLHVRPTSDFCPKGKHARTIHLGERLAEFLRHYVTEIWPALPGADLRPYLLRPDRAPGAKQARTRKKPGAFAWRYDPRAPFRKLVVANGLTWVGFHTMRHTFGTLHALAGTPLAVIAREMGDDMATTYKHYVGFSRDNSHASAVD